MPSSSRAAASAPASNRVLMTAGVFHPTAQCRGVAPSLVRAFTSTPTSSRSLTTAALRRMATRCRRVALLRTIPSLPVAEPRHRPEHNSQEGEQHTGPTRSNDNAIGSLGVKGGPTLSPNSVAPTVKTPEMPAIIATIPPSILMTISRYPTLLPVPPSRHHAPTGKLGPSVVIRQEEQLRVKRL